MGDAAWVDATAGVAGDMLLAALIDAGAAEERVRAAVASLGVPGLAVHTDTGRRGGLRCRRAHVVVPKSDHAHRHLAEILALVDGAELSAPARAAARETFTLLAEAEAAVHGTATAEVTLHEVGAHDALADVVGAVAAADDLGLLDADVVCSPLAAGSGTVRAAHGRLPVPVPAVVEIAARAGLELAGDLTGERTTPTGAALLAALARPGPFPAMTVRAVGVGGGARDTPDRPNITRLVRGTARAADAVRTGEVIVLEATVDDLDPQLWPSVLEAVRAAGAWDCWTSPIVARHGRPGHVLSAVCDEAARPAVADAVFRHTTTIGLRWSSAQRETLPRRAVTVDIRGREVSVKIARLGDGTERAKPEIADVEAVARALGVPAAEVAALALAALRSS
ncbi:nickel pincer cofactor biosynthesis protein LarC [Actinomycetospora flava]|uniref:Pyridinium-3,5-bisthiocarboxylic acid mononucleotide nickel insertion protein n=1 Tax=Actinomycetospora flava TaxID=3129232 RepID=A0ABU8M9E4_9PSEU